MQKRKPSIPGALARRRTLMNRLVGGMSRRSFCVAIPGSWNTERAVVAQSSEERSTGIATRRLSVENGGAEVIARHSQLGEESSGITVLMVGGSLKQCHRILRHWVA